jgi:hypothetical protein
MAEQGENLACVEPGLCGPAHVAATGGHVVEFSPAHGWMIGRVAIPHRKHRRSRHPDCSSRAEQRAPAETAEDPEQYRAHETQADVLGRRVDADRAAALVAGEPFRDDVAVGGEAGRFGETEREAEAQERSKSCGGRMRERRQRPAQQRERVDRARAESIEQDARRHLTEEVRPRERRKDEAHQRRAQRELLLNQRGRDPQYGTIQIVDRDRR